MFGESEVLLPPQGISPDLFETVMGWDTSRAKVRMHHETGLPPVYLDAVDREWKKYIVMLILNPEVEFPMSAPVDAFAHEHLSDTRNFQALCGMIPDCKMIHHQPTVDEKEKDALLPRYHDRTIPTMTALFGAASEDFWPRDRCVCTYDIETKA